MHSDGGVITSKYPTMSPSEVKEARKAAKKAARAEKSRIEKIRRRAAKAIRKAAAKPTAMVPPDLDEPEDPVDDGLITSSLYEEPDVQPIQCGCLDLEPCAACRFVATLESGRIFGAEEAVSEQ